MKKERRANDRLTFGSHVDFKGLQPMGTREIRRLREKVDKLLKKYEED